MKIMIIESDSAAGEFICEGIRKIMQFYEIKCVASGKEGLDLCSKFMPHIVLCSAETEEINGFEIIRLLRQQVKSQVIAIIGNDGSEKLMLRAFRAGADDYLYRPITGNDFRDFFQRWEIVIEDKDPDAMSSKDSRTILIVDDDLLLCRSLKRTLLKDKHKVLICTNAVDAIKLLKNQSVALVISDWHMPGINGIEFLKHVRIHFPETLTLMLTGHHELDGPINAINEAGVYRYMLKPYDCGQMRETVMRMLSFRGHIFKAQHLQKETKRIETMFKTLEQ